MPIEIVLVEPEIPQNTGNIARTCVAAGIRLHLVEPLGFSITEKAVRRAGLDYWYDTDITLWSGLDVFLKKNAGRPMYFATTKADRNYAEISYPDDCMILFGKETRGLPEPLLRSNPKTCIRIPMLEDKRSLNLSNAVAVIAYEYLRQKNFPGMLSGSDYLSGRTD
ncbi:MAG: tRNA (cytidine(34)-2'-O)-methyltransferase [Saccharofermentanales bacterium]